METRKPDRFNSETASLSQSDGTGENRLKEFLAWENRSVFVREEFLSLPPDLRGFPSLWLQGPIYVGQKNSECESELTSLSSNVGAGFFLRHTLKFHGVMLVETENSTFYHLDQPMYNIYINN